MQTRRTIDCARQKILHNFQLAKSVSLHNFTHLYQAICFSVFSIANPSKRFRSYGFTSNSFKNSTFHTKHRTYSAASPNRSRYPPATYLKYFFLPSVGHLLRCRKATAQILFLGYAPYPFQNFNSGLENTPLPHVYSCKKKAPAIADVAKNIFRRIWNPSYPTGCTIPHLHHGCGDHPFNHYARFWCRFAEHGQRGKCL